MADRRILGLILREHIGGRWAISWVLFVINVPFNMLSITTNISGQPEGGQWFGWFLVALAGLATIGVFFLLGDFVWFRKRRMHPVPVWAVGGFGALIGIVRGAVVVATADVLGVQAFTFLGLINRMIAGGLLGAIALPLGALVLSVINRYRSERRRLLDELAESERHRLAEQDQLTLLRSALVEDVRAEVHDVALTAIEAGGGAKEVSFALREASHSIWEGDATSVEREGRGATITSTLWQGVTSRPLPISWICSLWGLSAAASVLSISGLAWGGLQVLFSVGALALCLWLANQWITRKPSHWGAATATFVGLAWTLTSPVSYLLFDSRPLGTAVPIMVLNLFWLPAVVALVAFAAGAVTSSELVLARLRTSVDKNEVTTRAIEVERDSILRELAEQLHGSVHSPLVSQAALDSDRERLMEQVGQAVAALSAESLDVDLESRLAALAESWDGLVTVDVRVGGGQARSRDVERVVKEAIANAYRHGGAEWVRVSVTDSDGVEVLVEDDGRGPSESPSAGLGSRMFDTLGEWTLARRESRTVLRIYLNS